MTKYFRVFLICMAISLAFGALPQEPPPQGPPQATEDASGEFLITWFRSILETEGSVFIEEYNASSDHELSWAPGAKPTECGYSCVHPPHISSTDFLDQPNQHMAMVRARLKFDLDVADWPISRRIESEVILRVFCNGWRDGSGDIDIEVSVSPPFVSGGSGLLEDILDVVLMPVDLTSRINHAIQSRLSSPGSEFVVQNFSTCRSLSVIQNSDTGQFWSDRVVWDLPKPKPMTPEFISDYVVVKFENIKRKKVILPWATDDVSFFLYINGKGLQIPQTGILAIASEDVRQLQDVSIKLPSKNLETLQIIVIDSHGGTGWVQFDKSTKFGKGTHILRTSREGVIPPGEPGNPGTKPRIYQNREFELSYSIKLLGQVIKN